MQGDVNLLSGQLGVEAIDAKERVKRRGGIRTQQRLPQPRLADFADGQVLALVPGIPETGFPVPRLEIIAKFSHLTLQPDVEELVPVSELFTSRTGVVNAAKPNPRSHRETRSVRKEIWNSRIRDCEGIPRIRDWHTNAVGTKERVSAWRLERIGRKRYSCEGRIEI